MNKEVKRMIEKLNMLLIVGAAFAVTYFYLSQLCRLIGWLWGGV